MNGVLRNRRCARGGGANDDSAETDEARGIGIARHIPDQVSGAGHVRAYVVDSVHVVGAHNIVGNRTSRRAADRVVANRSGYASRLGVADASEAGAGSGSAVIDRDRADVVIGDHITGLEAKVEYSEESPGIGRCRCIVDNDTRGAVQAANGVTGGTADIEQTGGGANRDPSEPRSGSGPAVAGRLVEAGNPVILNIGHDCRARARCIDSGDPIPQTTDGRCSSAISRTESNSISDYVSGACAAGLNQNASIGQGGGSEHARCGLVDPVAGDGGGDVVCLDTDARHGGSRVEEVKDVVAINGVGRVVIWAGRSERHHALAWQVGAGRSDVVIRNRVAAICATRRCADQNIAARGGVARGRRTAHVAIGDQIALRAVDQADRAGACRR